MPVICEDVTYYYSGQWRAVSVVRKEITRKSLLGNTCGRIYSLKSIHAYKVDLPSLNKNSKILINKNLQVSFQNLKMYIFAKKSNIIGKGQLSFRFLQRVGTGIKR